MNHELRGEAVKRFIVAGNAMFTIFNDDTNGRFTFRVCRSKDNEHLYFVSVLTGPSNTTDYTYMGVLVNGTFKLTRGSKVSAEALSFRAFNWFARMLNAGRDFPVNFHFYHAGRCGRCGRTLTVPESIETGLGPECSKMAA